MIMVSLICFDCGSFFFLLKQGDPLVSILVKEFAHICQVVVKSESHLFLIAPYRLFDVHEITQQN